MKRITISLELLHGMFCIGREQMPHRVTAGLDGQHVLIHATTKPDGSLELSFYDGKPGVEDVEWLAVPIGLESPATAKVADADAVAPRERRGPQRPMTTDGHAPGPGIEVQG